MIQGVQSLITYFVLKELTNIMWGGQEKSLVPRKLVNSAQIHPRNMIQRSVRCWSKRSDKWWKFWLLPCVTRYLCLSEKDCRLQFLQYSGERKVSSRLCEESGSPVMKMVKGISPLLTKYSARDWREILQLEKVGKARLPKNSSAVDMTMDIDTADSQELKKLQFSLPLVSGGRKPIAVATLLERLKVNSPLFLLLADLHLLVAIWFLSFE